MTGQADNTTRLYLVVEGTANASLCLASALKAVPVACVLITPKPELSLEPEAIRPLIEAAQHNAAAALVLDDTALARACEADGVHLSPGHDLLTRYKDARKALGASSIVGAHAGKSRHAAMELGEASADYVAFGAPPSVNNRKAAEARRLELVSWWAEIFEVPCVAMDVATPQAAAELAAVDADFVAVSLNSETSAETAAALVRAIHEAIATAPRRQQP